MNNARLADRARLRLSNVCSKLSKDSCGNCALESLGRARLVGVLGSALGLCSGHGLERATSALMLRCRHPRECVAIKPIVPLSAARSYLFEKRSWQLRDMSPIDLAGR